MISLPSLTGSVSLRLQFRDGEEVLQEGDFLVVPRAVEHHRVADDEVHVMLVEPATTLNTGNVRNGRTVEEPQWI